MTRHRRVIDASLRRHLSAVYRTERLAGGMGQLVRAALRAALESIPDKPHPSNMGQALSRVRDIGDRLRLVAGFALAGRLRDLAEWGHLAMGRVLTSRAKEYTDDATGTNRNKPEQSVVPAGLASEFMREDLSDYLKLLIDPPGFDFLRLIVGDAPDLLTRLIDPPGFDFLRLIVGDAPDLLTRLIDPQSASNTVLQGIAQGWDRRRIAAELTDVFGGWESSARRVARTEGLRVATRTQLSASEEIPDLVQGYQVLSVLDARVRPEHRERHGTIYHRNPRGSQLGFDVMPQPPLDNPGSVLAHNCRCFLCPVFHLDEANADDVRDMLAAA